MIESYDSPFYLPKESMWCIGATAVFVVALVGPWASNYGEACQVSVQTMSAVYAGMKPVSDCRLISCGDYL